MLKLEEKLLFTSSLDNFICIWNLKGDLICKVNINYPLPFKWNLNNQNYEDTVLTIKFAIKQLESI